ncbi:retrovirus-related pol polyprotein from transposon RE1 [Tanacetum coccineum]
MHDETDALRKNDTWEVGELVPRPTNSNVIGPVDKFKARLVAQGFTQVNSLDYSVAFSPVVKSSTVRIVISHAVLYKWPLHQLDVKNAFVNGNHTDTVFMEQPPGFLDPRLPNHVCRLKKSLYGLKQAPGHGHRLSTFLVGLGFLCSRAYTSLFISKRDSCVLYLLVYVNDLILTGNQNGTIHNFISRLKKEFAITDLGYLSYFLGLEVSYTPTGLFISQSKYVHEIFVQAKLLDAKRVSSPLSTAEHFTTQGVTFTDPTLYRSLVGTLQYLTITRPDLSY